MRIPFTKYDVRLIKRGITVQDATDGHLVSLAEWQNGKLFTANTPILEEVYSTVANEFAKIDFKHVMYDKQGIYKQVNDDLDYLINQRPNPLQTKFDFLFTMAYQLFKYGNAIAFLKRDSRGYVTEIRPVDVNDWWFGNGYQIDEGQIWLKYKNKKNDTILLVDYKNVIHLRLNPNNIFYGDQFAQENYSNTMINLIDKSLAAALNELQENGTVRGIIQIGSAAQGFAGSAYANKTMTTSEAKIKAQQDVINRIKATKGGILVLDAGESWQSLANPFNTASTKNIDDYIDMLLEFNGINKKVVRGTATAAEMEVFYNKTIVPRIEQYLSELNYKVFTKTRITQGHRIEYYRNPFEYVPITEAINMAYKGSMDTTVNERRRMIYKLAPLPDGDTPMYNKNFGNMSRIGEDEDSTSLGKLKYNGKADYKDSDGNQEEGGLSDDE